MMFKPMTVHARLRAHARSLISLVLCAGLLFSAFAAAEEAEPSTLRVAKTDVRYTLDFSYLNEVVPNAVAWLYQPGTTIDQPVMHCDDPAYYLKRRFNDRLSPNGSIFMKGAETPDLTAPVVTLYGVNCMDYTLFGSLSYYQDEAYYQEHPTLFLLTPDGDYQLDIFAGLRTKLSDTETWTASNSASVRIKTDLPRILESSFITPSPSLLPVEGDEWAILATDSYKSQGGNRYVVYARKRPIDYATANVVYLNKQEMDARETLTKHVSVKDVGAWTVYAQNDPIWDRLTFEIQSCSRKRPFGDGGCGPTTVAMAVANLVEPSELPKISAYASAPFGYRFCSCSVNDYWCSGKHLPYQLTSPEEYARYFPIIVANFCTGNNIWGVQGRSKNFGTNLQYVEELCEAYGITAEGIKGLDNALEVLKNENTVVIASTGGYDSPFTKTSHFIVLVAVDDEYLYILDPLQRESYGSLDRRDSLEVIAPGLVRVTFENAAHCNIYPEYQLYR